ncbi:MAG: WD40 repeat domain-containing protein, partial [Nevskiales bacterium]
MPRQISCCLGLLVLLPAGAWAGEPRATLEGHRDAVTCLAYAPDGKTLATGSKDGTVRLWD